jgi:hypothetical protein
LEFLLRNAAEPAWRQVCIFYSSLTVDESASFLGTVVHGDVELAAYCIAAADAVPPALPGKAVELLLDRIRVGYPLSDCVSALVAMSRSVQDDVQGLAMKGLREALAPGQIPSASRFVNIEPDKIPQLMDIVASAGRAEVIDTLMMLCRAGFPEDPQMLPALWKCLTFGDLSPHDPRRRTVLDLLLTLSMSPDGVRLLNRQPRIDYDVPESARRRAYPFERGLPLDSNMVTALAVADETGTCAFAY